MTIEGKVWTFDHLIIIITTDIPTLKSQVGTTSQNDVLCSVTFLPRLNNSHSDFLAGG